MGNIEVTLPTMEQRPLAPGTRAKILMLQKGIKPRDVAEAVGLSTNYVYRLLSGHCVVKEGRRKLSDFFGEDLWTESQPTEAKAA